MYISNVFDRMLKKTLKHKMKGKFTILTIGSIHHIQNFRLLNITSCYKPK